MFPALQPVSESLKQFFAPTFNLLEIPLSPGCEEFLKLGTLVLIGGAEDNSKEPSILSATLALCEAKRVVVCPSASRIGDEVGRDYRYIFMRMGAKSVDVIDPHDPKDADSPRNLDLLQKADLIFFSGGDQVKLVHLIRETQFLTIVRQRWLQGAIIAGTSAGAAAAGSPMIYDGNRRGFNKNAVHQELGFGLLYNVMVDTHFTKRRRLSRLAQAVASGICPFGIGLDEDSGIMVRGDGTFTVVGSSMVTVLDGRSMQYTNYAIVPDDSLITIAGLRVGFLAPGTSFNMATWSVIPTL
jgi:cyanophycinase